MAGLHGMSLRMHKKVLDVARAGGLLFRGSESSSSPSKTAFEEKVMIHERNNISRRDINKIHQKCDIPMKFELVLSTMMSRKAFGDYQMLAGRNNAKLAIESGDITIKSNEKRKRGSSSLAKEEQTKKKRRRLMKGIVPLSLSSCLALPLFSPFSMLIGEPVSFRGRVCPSDGCRGLLIKGCQDKKSAIMGRGKTDVCTAFKVGEAVEALGEVMKELSTKEKVESTFGTWEVLDPRSKALQWYFEQRDEGDKGLPKRRGHEPDRSHIAGLLTQLVEEVEDLEGPSVSAELHLWESTYGYFIRKEGVPYNFHELKFADPYGGDVTLTKEERQILTVMGKRPEVQEQVDVEIIWLKSPPSGWAKLRKIEEKMTTDVVARDKLEAKARDARRASARAEMVSAQEAKAKAEGSDNFNADRAIMAEERVWKLDSGRFQTALSILMWDTKRLWATLPSFVRPSTSGPWERDADIAIGSWKRDANIIVKEYCVRLAI
ncbi:hypothetical protein ACLOJK_006024 [Asimina triloba]